MNVSVKEASLFLGYSEQYVRRLIRQGALPAEKISDVWVLPWDAVLKYDGKNEITKIEIADHGRRGKARKKINCLSFFSGAMGLDIGLEKAGIETLLACEVDRACRETIEANRPEIALLGDIRDYTSKQIIDAAGLETQSVDLMVGGPPCQAFSSAGRRQGFSDDRGNVFLDFIDRILEIRPKFAVIENVRGLLSAPLKHIPHSQRNDASYSPSLDEKRGSALYLILAQLRSAGYSVSFNLYNSANFGSPQKRERVIIVCSRDVNELPFLEPSHSERELYGLPKWRSLRDAISDLKKTKHDYVKFPEKRLRYYRMLNAGENWRSLSVEMQKEALGKSYFSGGGKTGFYRRLSWDKPSPTLVTHPAMPATDLCHPEDLRPLSVQEYKRIQEFPDSWLIKGKILDQYKQIGNAVPTSLGEAVGKLILNANDGDVRKSITDFPFSRYKNTNHRQWEAAFHAQ